MATRRKRAGRPRSIKPRHPGGQVVRDSVLPPAEVIARRGANWRDQDAGDIFGIMQARGMLPDRSGEKVNGIPGPQPSELKVAGQGYAALVAAYERSIGAPRCATPSDGGGRSLSTEDVAQHARTQAQSKKALEVLRKLDHRCVVALARAVAALTHEQIEDALQWSSAIVPALAALHSAADDIRAAGKTASARAQIDLAA